MVVTLSHKVNGLTFLKPEMSKVWTVLEDMILKFGPDGRIEGGDFVRLAATMKTCLPSTAFCRSSTAR